MGFAALLLALASAAAGGEGARLAAELGALARGGQEDAVVARLGALGPALAPELLAALGRAELAPEGGERLALGPREQAVLARVALGLGREAFQAHWSEATRAEDADLRLGVVRAVGLVGGAGDLRVAAEAARARAGGATDERAAPALEHALDALLQRDAGTLALLKPVLLALSPELAGRLVRVASEIPDPRVLTLLVDCLGVEPQLELPLLGGIVRAARAHGVPHDERACAAVRPYLRHPGRQVARAAAEAAGALEDAQAVELLLELAAAPDRGLSAAAFQALRSVTQQVLPERVERWRAWFASERRWEAERTPVLRDDLRAGDPALVCAALRELEVHPLRRAELAELVAGLREHPQQSVRQAADRLAQRFWPEPAARALATAPGPP